MNQLLSNNYKNQPEQHPDTNGLAVKVVHVFRNDNEYVGEGFNR